METNFTQTSSPIDQVTLHQRRLEDFMDFEDPQIQNDPSAQISEYVLDQAGSELGFFCVLIMACIFLLLNQVDGKVFRLKIFLMNRDFNLIQNDGLVRFVNFTLRFITWMSYTLPFLSLAVWAAGLLIRAKDFDTSPVAGITILLVGFALIFFTYGIFLIKWNNYSFGFINAFCFLMSLFLITAYQFLVITLDNSSRSFFGYSAVYMNANFIILVFTVFLNSGIPGGSITDVIKNKLQKGEELDPFRETDFIEEIDQQRANKEFLPTFSDIVDLFTVDNGEPEKDLLKGSSFGGGTQTRFRLLNQSLKRFITFFLWCFATGILVVYSFVIYDVFEESRLGFVNMIATVITDVFIYLVWNAKITRSTTVLCFAGLLNRLLLFVFGGNQWIYGYIIIYLIYGIILSFVVAERRFPFEDAYNEIDLDCISEVHQSFDVARAPEFLFLFITICYIILFAVLYFAEPLGVPLPRFYMDDYTYPYYMIGLFVLILVITFLALVCTYRLFMRKKKNIQPQIFFYLKNKKFDMYWMFITISFVLLAIVGLICSWITDIISTFIIIIFISIFVIFYLNVFLHYQLNGFNILQNIEAQNVKIRKHNLKIQELKQKVTVIKKDLKEGKSTVIGAGSADLAKSIIQRDNQKKQEDKKQKEILTKSINPQLQLSKFGSNQRPSVMGPNARRKSGVKPFDPYEDVPVTILVQKTPMSKIQPVSVTINPPPAVQSQLSSSRAPGDDDKLIQEEMDKVVRDEIYEGGEEEQPQPGLNLQQSPSRYSSNQVAGSPVVEQEDEEDHQHDDSNESSDEEVDFDAQDDEVNSKKQKRPIKEITDWRKETNGINAFFQGKLRSNDYQIIFSLIVAHCAIILMAGLVYYSDESDYGIQIAVPLVHYSMAGFALYKNLSTDSKISAVQYFFFFLAYLIQYGWGIGCIYLNYTSQDLDPTLPGAATAGTYMLVYLMVIPFVTSSVSSVAKLYDDQGKITPYTLLLIILSGLQIVGMLVLAYIYTTYIQGVIISVVTAALFYAILQVFIYVKNDYYLPRVWTVINIIIVAVIVISCTVVSLFFDQFRTYTGISISVWVFCVFLMIYAGSELSSDLANIEKKPIFFSPSIFPVYIYNPKKNDVDPKNGPTIALLTSLVILMLWSVTCTVWVYPHNIGVSVGILLEAFIIISCFHLISVSANQLHEITKEIDKKILRRAFLDSKSGYVNSRQAINRDQLLTYEKITWRRDNFRNFMRVKEKRARLSLEEKSEGVHFIPDNDIDMEWVDENKVDLTSVVSCFSYLYVLEKDQNRIYREELEFIIQFQLLIVSNTESFSEQKKKYLFTFIQEKKAALFALGIIINIPDTGTMTVRYARVITQIQKLTPEKQTIFNKLREQFIQEQRDLDEKRKEAARIEEEKQKARQELLGQLSEEKKRQLENVTLEMDVDDMPDCDIKFKKIKLEAQQEQKLFVDKKFSASNESLGEKCLNRGVTQWVRARDKPECVLYKDKINHLDVVQGALGDCYFLSAISVLGEKYVKKIIISSQEDWKKTGAFCVQFYKNGDPETIIIDDFFPAYPNGDWAFVKGGNGDELWPMVLEKAYAKMYSNYNYIEAGKVQYALSDMTDGFPEQIDLKQEGKNIQKLWEVMKSLRRHGALMGAGTPENALGDRAINELGIVQGHAYSVLDVQEFDGHRLVQLRNPHGSAGVEWNGDWSDSSEKWDERMKNKVSFESSTDGVFWMEVLDFVQQYSYLYICRILDKDDGWHERNINDSWKGGSAEGLPSRTNPNARLDFNPQYAITITKPSDGFISLRQFQTVNMFKGKHNIFFMVAKLNGKRITKIDKATIQMKSGNPTNLNVITGECDFDKSVQYPYKFTLMICNLEHGKVGEGPFEFSVYSTDPNMKVEPLPFPKDFPKEGAGQNEVE